MILHFSRFASSLQYALFLTKETIMVYISLDRQVKMLFVDISFTKIGKLRSVYVCDKLKRMIFSFLALTS